MKKVMTTLRAALAALLLVIGSTNANANSWRINNDVTKKAHFTSINAAMSSADVVAGDTLYLDPGCVLNEQTISKRITLIGTGYASTAHNVAYITGFLTITATNTKVEGVYATGDFRLSANYITLERCKVDNHIVYVDYGKTGQYATIRQCQVNNYISGAGTSDTRTLGWTIENCIIKYNSSCIYDLYNPVIRNNYICSTFNNSGYTICGIRNVTGGNIYSNVILMASRYIGNTLSNLTNCSVHENVLSCATDSNYPNNRFLEQAYDVAEPTLFTMSGDDMNIYQLKDDSPAKGAGLAGEDCGPWTGNYPYVLYGRPYGIPYISASQVAGRAVDGKVSVKQTVVIQND